MDWLGSIVAVVLAGLNVGFTLYHTRKLGLEADIRSAIDTIDGLLSKLSEQAHIFCSPDATQHQKYTAKGYIDDIAKDIGLKSKYITDKTKSKDMRYSAIVLRLTIYAMEEYRGGQAYEYHENRISDLLEKIYEWKMHFSELRTNSF